MLARLPGAPFAADDVLSVSVFYKDADNTMHQVTWVTGKEYTLI